MDCHPSGAPLDLPKLTWSACVRLVETVEHSLTLSSPGSSSLPSSRQYDSNITHC